MEIEEEVVSGADAVISVNHECLNAIAPGVDAPRFVVANGFDETIVVPGYYRGREAALRMIRVLRATSPVPYTWRPTP